MPLGRHVAVTGDADLAHTLAPSVSGIVEHHLAGTRFGIKVDGDGLITQGAEGWALTWMDARVDGQPVTPRFGKPVEVNALWISGLQALSEILRDADNEIAERIGNVAANARQSFQARFVRADGGGLLDVVDPDDGSVRPNQLLAVGLPHAPIDDAATAAAVVRACRAARHVNRRSVAHAERPPVHRPPSGRSRRTRSRIPPGDGLAVAARSVRRRVQEGGHARRRCGRRRGRSPCRLGRRVGVGDR